MGCSKAVEALGSVPSTAGGDKRAWKWEGQLAGKRGFRRKGIGDDRRVLGVTMIKVHSQPW